jgi:hypothetical protein
MSPEADEPTPQEGLVAYGLSSEALRAMGTAFTQALEVAGPNFGKALRDLQTTVGRAEPLALLGTLAWSKSSLTREEWRRASVPDQPRTPNRRECRLA